MNKHKDGRKSRRNAKAALDTDQSDEDFHPISSSQGKETSQLGELNYCFTELNIGDYVIVKIETKKKRFHYAGQIVCDDNERMIKYLKRENQSYKFIFQNDQVFDFSVEDIVCKLPNPSRHGGTARLSSHLSFPVNLSVFSNLR